MRKLSGGTNYAFAMVTAGPRPVKSAGISEAGPKEQVTAVILGGIVVQTLRCLVHNTSQPTKAGGVRPKGLSVVLPIEVHPPDHLSTVERKVRKRTGPGL
jgi:hypothetical protein